MSAEPLPITAEECVIRSTHRQKGRTEWLAPGQGAVRQLHYGRVILDAGQTLTFNTGGRETGFIALGGAASIAVASESFSLTPYDALYIPRDSTVRVSTAEGCDLAEVSAPVSGNYPLQFVRFAQVRQDPALHFIAGGANTTRDLNILIGRNVQAGRILAGVTFSEPGHWTSWPPHEHAAMLEEAYLYVAMPAPAFAVQLVYTNPNEPELATIVHEGDVVLMPCGYHPNVAAPGCRVGFVWMMAANREVEDRQFGVVNVQPAFAAMGSGLDPGRAPGR